MNINQKKIKFLNTTMENLDVNYILDCELIGVYEKITNFIEKKTGNFIYFIDDFYETNDDKCGLVVSYLANTTDWNMAISIFNYSEKLFNKKFGQGLEVKFKIKPNYEIVDLIRNNKIYKTMWYFIDGEIELSITSGKNNSVYVELSHKHHYNFELAYNKFKYEE